MAELESEGNGGCKSVLLSRAECAVHHLPGADAAAADEIGLVFRAAHVKFGGTPQERGDAFEFLTAVAGDEARGRHAVHLLHHVRRDVSELVWVAANRLIASGEGPILAGVGGH